MPEQPAPAKTLEEIAEEVGLYPIEAYVFVQNGLQHTVKKLKGEATGKRDVSRHVTGQELSEGLRDFALLQWGFLAGTVLKRWNVTRTDDFGRIVFSLIEYGWMSKTEEDNEDDFRNVFDFRTAFEGYRIECKS